MTVAIPQFDLSSHDDFRVLSRDLTDAPGFVLTGMVKDEMFFLPAFLAHYRALGVERFILLDDKSTDGTRDYLCAQSDCMVLASDRSFGEAPRPGPAMPWTRMEDVWRNILIRKYASGRWALHVDADEFLRLPDGMTIQRFAQCAEAAGHAAIWAVMIELYPPSIADLQAMRADTRHDPDADWHYDARRHFRMNAPGVPKTVYPGARARLMQDFAPRPRTYTPRQRLRLRPLRDWLTGRIPPRNCLHKTPLMKMPADGFVHNVHRPGFPAAPRTLLPLEHFKFTGQLFDRVQTALASGEHFNGSAEYRDMQALLGAMALRQASFMCACSSNARGYADYLRAKVASEG